VQIYVHKQTLETRSLTRRHGTREVHGFDRRSNFNVRSTPHPLFHLEAVEHATCVYTLWISAQHGAYHIRACTHASIRRLTRHRLISFASSRRTNLFTMYTADLMARWARSGDTWLYSGSYVASPAFRRKSDHHPLPSRYYVRSQIGLTAVARHQTKYNYLWSRGWARAEWKTKREFNGLNKWNVFSLVRNNWKDVNRHQTQSHCVLNMHAIID